MKSLFVTACLGAIATANTETPEVTCTIVCQAPQVADANTCTCVDPKAEDGAMTGFAAATQIAVAVTAYLAF